MKKRIIPLLVCCALIFMFAAVVSACDDTQELPHEHVFSEEWIFDVEEHWHKCNSDSCDEISDKSAHDFDLRVIKEATCSEEGIGERYCKVCGFAERTTLGYMWHDFVVTKDVQPTCEESGEYSRVCSECGFCEEKVIPALGHSLSTVSAKVATCTEPGWYGYVYCNRCDFNNFKEIPALGHNLSHVKAKAPTCTDGGWNDYDYCLRCDYSTYEELPALGHDIVNVEAKAPTCTQYGWEEYEYCENCDYNTSVGLIDPLGHELSDHECIRCDKSLYDSYLYGYDYLGTLPNGEGRQALYDMIAKEAAEFHKNTDIDVEVDYALGSFDISALGLTDMEAISVWKTFKDDNPIYYWMANSVYISETLIEMVVDNDYRLGETRKYYNKLIDEAVMSLADQVYKGATDYDTALCYHDNITLSIDYAYDENNQPEKSLWAHNIIGVLEKTGAVCEGYARTFQLLLNYSDVENLLVTGKSNGVGHAWNVVRLDDGNWYWCDLTYDDIGSSGMGTLYKYFCAVDDNFVQNHTFDTSAGESVYFLYDLPERADRPYKPDGLALGDIIRIDDMSFEVVGYNAVSLIGLNDVEDAVIPENIEYEGRIMKVVAIGREEISAMSSNIRSLYIPASVRMIWDYALLSKTLERIEVSPENPYYTSVDGVLYTKNMYTLIAFPAAAETERFVVPDDTYCIAHGAFNSCKNLSSIKFGKNVRTVGVVNWGNGYPTKLCMMNVISGEIKRIFDTLKGEKKFEISPENKRFTMDDVGIYNYSMSTLYCVYNTSITSYRVPAALSSMSGVSSDDDLFEDCKLLERFIVDESDYFSEFGGILYDKEQTKIVSVPKAIKGKVIVADGVTEIGGYAFADCTGITEIILPEGLKIIRSLAFKTCTSLTSITIPDSVETITDQAFYGCTSLKTVVLGEGLSTIKIGAFTDCTSLEEITLPASVKYIGKQVFLGCTALKKVIFNNPNGWGRKISNMDNVEITPFSSEDLSNSEIAKDYLTSDYVFYVWERI